MKKHGSYTAFVLCLVGVFALAGVLTVWAQSGREAFTALAKWKSPSGEEKKARLTIVIERYTTDAERQQAIDALKSGGTTALQKVLEKMPATGYIQINDLSRSAVRFTRSLDMAGGRLITLITDRPLGFIGGAEPGAKDKAGYEVGYVSLEVKTGKVGQGDAAPAVKLKLSDEGAVSVEDYGGREVWLSEVQAVKP